MKNKICKLIIAGTLVAFTLTGCGDGSDSADRPQTPPSKEVTAEASQSTEEPTETQPQESQEDSEIASYEAKYAAGDFTAEDFKALASLYEQKGYIKKQRDLLEQCWRLYNDKEAFTALQNITVNIAEENTQIQEMVSRLQQNLDFEEYLNEAVGLLMNPDWISVMMPKLQQGHRNYYLTAENGNTLVVEAGYDTAGQATSQVWYLTSQDQVRWIGQTSDSLQMMTTTQTNGKYHGAFDSWLVMASSGDVYHETGTFTQGVLTGDYTAQVKFGSNSLDLFSAWGTKADMEFTDYTGNFGEDGITTVEQPKSTSKVTNGGNGEDSYIVYAYNKAKSKFLFLNTKEEPSAFVFQAEAMGLQSCPSYTPYEPTQDSETSLIGKGLTAEDVEIRVNEGNIEWFDGENWNVAGKVSEDGSDGNEGTTEGKKTSAHSVKGGGSVAKDPEKTTTNTTNPPKTNTNPSTNTNANTNKPVDNKPSETPSTPPDDDDDDDDGGSGGDNNQGNNGSTDGGNGGDTPSNGGGNGGDTPSDGGGNGGDTPSDGGGNGGDSGSNSGDVDIEWTDDIL